MGCVWGCLSTSYLHTRYWYAVASHMTQHHLQRSHRQHCSPSSAARDPLHPALGCRDIHSGCLAISGPGRWPSGTPVAPTPKREESPLKVQGSQASRTTCEQRAVAGIHSQAGTGSGASSKVMRGPPRSLSVLSTGKSMAIRPKSIRALDWNSSPRNGLCAPKTSASAPAGRRNCLRGTCNWSSSCENPGLLGRAGWQ